METYKFGNIMTTDLVLREDACKSFRALVMGRTLGTRMKAMSSSLLSHHLTLSLGQLEQQKVIVDKLAVRRSGI
ncbi:MAG: hypothetical protein C0509_05555 [Acinetobacter sp.]|nr:hypothetical protein [Acinetobacter sp.]